MTGDDPKKRRTTGPLPPFPTFTSERKKFQGYRRQEVSEFADHAKEVREISRGRDIDLRQCHGGSRCCLRRRVRSVRRMRSHLARRSARRVAVEDRA